MSDGVDADIAEAADCVARDVGLQMLVGIGSMPHQTGDGHVASECVTCLQDLVIRLENTRRDQGNVIAALKVDEKDLRAQLRHIRDVLLEFPSKRIPYEETIVGAFDALVKDCEEYDETAITLRARAETAEAERDALQPAIDTWAEHMAWAADVWKREPHNAALFALANLKG